MITETSPQSRIYELVGIRHISCSDRRIAFLRRLSATAVFINNRNSSLLRMNGGRLTTSYVSQNHSIYGQSVFLRSKRPLFIVFSRFITGFSPTSRSLRPVYDERRYHGSRQCFELSRQDERSFRSTINRPKKLIAISIRLVQFLPQSISSSSLKRAIGKGITGIMCINRLYINTSKTIQSISLPHSLSVKERLRYEDRVVLRVF
jgi:hypothetical protein